MTFIKTSDGTQIFYKDWGPKDAQPIVFHHGWPLSADDWDAQMMFFLGKGYRVVAHDRRGHGRSTQTADGQRHGHLCSRRRRAGQARSTLKTPFHIGHSTGGGEVARYVARAEPGRVAKAVLISAVPPLMLKKRLQPGRPADRGVRRVPRWHSPTTAPNSSSTSPPGPFYGFNRPGAKVSEGLSATGGARA